MAQGRGPARSSCDRDCFVFCCRNEILNWSWEMITFWIFRVRATCDALPVVKCLSARGLAGRCCPTLSGSESPAPRFAIQLDEGQSAASVAGQACPQSVRAFLLRACFAFDFPLLLASLRHVVPIDRGVSGVIREHVPRSRRVGYTHSAVFTGWRNLHKPNSFWLMALEDAENDHRCNFSF